MRIIVYSDSNYEYQVKNLLSSLEYSGSDLEVIYYTIGFRSSVNNPRVHRVYMKHRPELPKFEFYKPSICLHAIDSCDENFLYVDTDILFSKRFSTFEYHFGETHPVACEGPLEYPYTWEGTPDNHEIFNERKLMDYFGVEKRSMNYITACFFSFNSESRDFIEEWQSIAENPYLLKSHRSVFPFTDETALNVLFWKRGISLNYGRKFVNTHEFSTFKICEENDEVNQFLIDGNMYEQAEKSSQVYFYHGTKVHEENRIYKRCQMSLNIHQIRKVGLW